VVAGAATPPPAVTGATAAAAAAPALRMPDYRRVVLPNGVVLLMMPLREVPMVAFTAVLRGGALGVPQDRAGLASLAAGLLEKGAGARDAFQFADAVAGAGGRLATAAGAESITLSGQFLARDRELMVGLLADALLRPRLDAVEFDKLRARQVELIRAAKDSDPSGLLDDYGRALLFGAHPYGQPVDGTERTLAAVTHADLREFWATRLGADRLTLVFAGDLDPAWLEAAVRRAFGALGRARVALPPLPEPRRVAGRRVLLVDSPGAAQTYFWIANVGVARRYPARAALDIVNTLYGGRFTSILNTELRIKSGLSYGARSAFVRGSVAGEFAISSFAQTENTARAVDLALETLGRLRREPVAAPRPRQPHHLLRQTHRPLPRAKNRCRYGLTNPRVAPTCSASIRCGSRPRPTGPASSPTSSSTASIAATSRVMVRRSPRLASRTRGA
jgi:predicted Zn-dependent peptidase